MKYTKLFIKSVFLFIIYIIVNNSVVFSQNNLTDRLLPEQFSENAFQHIKNLTKRGPRATGSENETWAAKYIKKQFEKLDIEARIETFEYQSFEFSSIDYSIGNKKFLVTGLGFVPYKR